MKDRLSIESDAVVAGVFTWKGQPGDVRHSVIQRGALAVIPTRAVEIRHGDGVRIIADARTVVLYRPEQEYEARMLVPEGERSFFFRVEWPKLMDLRAPAAMPLPAPLHARHAAVQRQLQDPDLDLLAREETCLAFIDLLTESFQRQGIDNPCAAGATPWQIEAGRHVQRILATQYSQKLTLSAIARQVGVSPHHLCRLFRRITGHSIHATLTELRLREAIHLLADGGSSLAHVALDVGFCSQSHFTRAFTRQYGVPPACWRRALPLKAHHARA